MATLRQGQLYQQGGEPKQAMRLVIMEHSLKRGPFIDVILASSATLGTATPERVNGVPVEIDDRLPEQHYLVIPGIAPIDDPVPCLNERYGAVEP